MEAKSFSHLQKFQTGSYVPLTPLFIWQRDYFPGVKRLGLHVDLLLVPSLRMSGVIRLLLPMPSWGAQGLNIQDVHPDFVRRQRHI